MIRINIAKREWVLLALAMLLAAGIKLGLVLAGTVPFNSDEAVVALMARHILQGARPVFFYGQAYMGSLDSWLIASAYSLFGETVLAVRLVQIAVYLLYMLSIWLLTRSLFSEKRIAVLVVALAAVPTVMVTTYTTASLGGYGEILVLGNLILWLGYQVTWGRWQGSWLAWLVLGIIGGLAFWTLGMAVVYLLPVGVMIARRFRRGQLGRIVCGLTGFVIGSSPWWYYNLAQNWAALRTLVDSGAGDTTPWEHLISFALLGMPAVAGLRFPWSAEFSPLPVLAIGLLLYLAAGMYVVWSLKNDRKIFSPGAVGLLSLYTLAYLLAFIGTRFGIDGTGRYLLPLNLLIIISLAIMINAAWQRSPAWGMGILLLVLAVNAAETWRAASLPEKITTQFDPVTRFDNRYDAALISFLRQNGEERGYSNYWVSFRLAFLSAEQLIFAPALPYKTDLSYAPSDNRYPGYGRLVSESRKVAYITSLNPNLDGQLRAGMVKEGVSFEEQQIGPYHIFYNLSRAAGPLEIGLASSSP